MKKGQKVRVLADNRIGIVADSHFFHWGNKRMVQHQVKFSDTKGEAPWFPAEKLTTNLVEDTKVVITGEKGTLYLSRMRTRITTHRVRARTSGRVSPSAAKSWLREA